MFKLVEGLGSTLGLVNTLTLIFVVIAVVVILAKLGMLKIPGRERKQTVVDPQGYNPHGPGQAKVCGEHKNALIKIETTLEIKFTEINRRLEVIERKVNNGRT